ncbi:MAG TPA: serine/threonine-protein kinase [Gemmatimonadales bacterium]|nr:serine/threonine-protein kinase [Gemmatimonadales bacterium]
MHEHVTLVGPEPAAGETPRLSALPRDLLEQVRGRVRLLALLLLIGFALDPAIFLIGWTVGTLSGVPVRFGNTGFVVTDLGVVLASLGVWWMAGEGRVSPSRLLTLGLVYEVAICFALSLIAYWQWTLDLGTIPPLIWVPTVIVLFPLVMPGPPRRMLTAAIAAGLTAPLALLLLDLWNKVTPTTDDYIRSVVNSAFGVGFAYMGARVVYRLGRQVAAARELGSYRLEAKLGQGGMGEVWRARHRMLARPAAIKVIRPPAGGQGVTDELQRRFEQEAQAIARLRSPHTVELYDFGVAENGAFYYVMELLDGLDTDALVRRHGPLPAARTVYLLRQICHSLAEAQACGLVHRDIKPANVFLCRYGEDHDFVKVLDFGLVKALDGRAGKAAPGLTMENMVQGTPAFIAPEQAMGDDGVDGRADIYATGCVAYWLLTGQHVFTADTSMGVLIHHAQSRPTPPSERVELPIPHDLEQLVMECLAKNPADRPQSARELSLRLAEVADATRWTEVEARQWWATHRPV